MFKISNSKLKTWRRCRKQYDYKYNQKLRKRIKSAPLIRGSVMHEMIDAKAKGKNPWKTFRKEIQPYYSLFKEQQDEYGDLPQMIRALMRHYFRFYKGNEFEYIESEIEFEYKLTKDILLIGYVDGTGRQKPYGKGIVEHKSHKKIPEGDLEYSQIQTALYAEAIANLYNMEVDFVMWNYIRAKNPSTPKLLADGTLSKRNIDTLWEIYKAEVRKQGLKVEDYLDMRDKLKDKETTYFVRNVLPLKPQIVSQVVKDSIFTAEEMIEKGKKDTTRTIDKHCQWCDYYSLCQAELRGLDAGFIRKANFVERKEETNEENPKEKKKTRHKSKNKSCV